jgi:hypothetical protein
MSDLLAQQANGRWGKLAGAPFGASRIVQVFGLAPPGLLVKAGFVSAFLRPSRAQIAGVTSTAEVPKFSALVARGSSSNAVVRAQAAGVSSTGDQLP